jgi:hypothetical protein
MASKSTARALAFTDGVLVYCPPCVKNLNLPDEGVTSPSRLPFASIEVPDDLPQKVCDRCDRYLADGADGSPWD